MGSNLSKIQERGIDKLSYEIFSILESKFLFGYNDQSSRFPSRSLSRPPKLNLKPKSNQPPSIIESWQSRTKWVKFAFLASTALACETFSPVKALAYLENALKLKFGNLEAIIADYFDVAAGSDVRGIFTAMLLSLKDQGLPIFKADDTWRFLSEQEKRFYRSSGFGFE
ncbi:patatin-like protein 6 [Carya illinoinensis]|uniref:patatin-like protein 6 n=1 Tax=Carya illinoinensis TaxID=32201 RepID=UPI001C71D2E0|nr:patatin-like protein 6 [Carya illinoinensis]